MSEKIKWYQDKNAMISAAVFAVVAWIFLEGLKKVIESYATFLESHSSINELVNRTLSFLPWFVLIVITFLYRRWRKKAKAASTTLIETKTILETTTHNLADSQAKLQCMLKWEGIERITGLDKYIKKLEGSGHHPRELLGIIDIKLDFMGHGASKWTANREKLEGMLNRIKYNQGTARFLVINPLLTGLDPERAKQIARSLRTLLELKATHTNLEVKVYEHIPQLRLTFYDDDLVVVGHYQGFERQDSSNTPLLVFLRICDWSFYKAFLSHFDEEWKRATNLDTLDVSTIENLAKG